MDGPSPGEGELGTRYEFFDARRTTVELWSSAGVAEQTGEELAADQVALSLAGDEVTVVVGTPTDLRALAEKITCAVAEEVPGELRTLVPGEVDDFLTCPDCGELGVSIQEVDYRRGARWTPGGSVNIRKSSEVETLDVDLYCPNGHGSFELPDVDDYE
jgi:hypothetical protein